MTMKPDDVGGETRSCVDDRRRDVEAASDRVAMASEDLKPIGDLCILEDGAGREGPIAPVDRHLVVGRLGLVLRVALMELSHDRLKGRDACNGVDHGPRERGKDRSRTVIGNIDKFEF